jgi:hypothetical protein
VAVQRTFANHQTTYELRDDSGLSCVLTYTAAPDEPATWKILMPGPDGTEDLFGARQFPNPDSAQLQSWLSAVIGAERAAELADAVDAAPPPPSAWRSRNHLG